MLLSDAAYLRVRQAIAGGGIEAGSAMSESQLSRELKMSRTPVREALRRLQAEGMIEPVAQGGYVLVKFDEKQLVDVYTVQSVLEGLSSQLAARNRSRSNLGRIGDVLDAMDLTVRCGDEDEITQQNADFHDAIAQATTNEYLRASLASIRDIVIRHRPQAANPPAHRELAHDEHRRLFDAISAGDAESAERIAREHFEHGLAGRLEAVERAREPKTGT